jgi:2-desacetyl-2-hydroxyethyl bacteriochlorophyllide A dehydrogenase
MRMKGPKRIVWPEKGRAALEPFDLAKPGDDEMLIETEYTLISPGTELAFLNALPNTPGLYPQYPGYNNVGRIVELGPHVTGFAEGDRVASAAKHASMATVPASRVTDVPAGLEPEKAVYHNMVAISLQAVRKAQIELGESVLVLGQGIIGNLALQLARLSGGLPVIGTDLVDRRLGLARECGADLAVNPHVEDLKTRLMELYGRDSVDVVLDATGVPQVIPDALDFAGYRGRVVLLASTRGETERVNFYRDVHKKGLIIIGAHNNIRPKGEESTRGYWTAQDDAAVALRLMAAGRLKVAPLTTDVLRAEEAPAAYDLLVHARDEHLGVLLDWQ